jgi:hypothetical protein
VASTSVTGGAVSEPAANSDGGHDERDRWPITTVSLAATAAVSEGGAITYRELGATASSP